MERKLKEVRFDARAELLQWHSPRNQAPGTRMPIGHGILSRCELDLQCLTCMVHGIINARARDAEI